MSIHKTEAIVLSRHDFRETSLIVNFYTRDFGKLSGLLKGIREEPGKFASTLEPFSLNDVIFYRKRASSLHLVSQCDTKNNFHFIRKDISRIGLASMMMELIKAVMPAEDKNEDIFDLALASLNELEVNSNPDKIITIFKIKRLKEESIK